MTGPSTTKSTPSASARRSSSPEWHEAPHQGRSGRPGVDFVVLGPVIATPSHPGSVPLGWERFREIAAGAAVPVYALGGMVPPDLERALSCGGHGLAMVRGAWDG